MDEWMDAVGRELGVEDEFDTDALLKTARVVAHQVERKAAPLTTFLIGLAAGRAGGDAAAVSRVTAKVDVLARSWEPSD